MSYTAEIPYGAYWSTPFAKWQGSFANLNSIEFAAHVAKAELAKREIPVDAFDYGVLGITVPQKHSFYGLPWFTGLIGADGVGGPTINQACTTSARCMLAAAQEIEAGLATTALVATCDRTSNGPHVVYPDTSTPGGTVNSENWVLDNFGCDPLGPHAMIDTAENVARRYQVSTEEQHEVVVRRGEQYAEAVADDHAFHKRYMSLPFEVPRPGYKRAAGTLDGDEGIALSSAEGLAKLRPVKPDGTITFGGQTYPADGSAAMAIAAPDQAKELSARPDLRISLHGFGLARTELAHMSAATIPAAGMALEQAGLTIDQIDAIKSHNPFAANDIVFARETGADLMSMNNYGCSLIWGHPQGPTGLRAVIELIEELEMRGGGRGLFQGCAAGDTAMAVVLSVEDRSA